MNIVIITRGRVGKQYTLESLPLNCDHYKVKLLCPPDEVMLHRANHPDIEVILEADEPLDYSEKFHRIVNGHYPQLGKHIVIMDDDLRFSMRDPSGTGSLIKASPEAILLGLGMLRGMMEQYPLVGLHPRAMGNNAPRGVKEVARINAVQGLNLDLIGPLKVNYWPILADMVLNLKLLTRGQKTAVCCELFWDQVAGSNAPGGCSLHRTPEQQDIAVRGLFDMFPDVVTVKYKEIKTGGWFGGERTDFIVKWQKAYQMGVAHARESQKA